MASFRSASGPRGDLPDGVRWVADADGLDQLIDELVDVEVFAVDTEFHREKTYFPQLALVQVAWKDQRVLLDPLAVEIGPFGRALVGSATVVMHAASQDLEVLDLRCGVLPERLFDTQLAAGFVGHSLPSLAALHERYLGLHLPKGDRLTDWLRRPLGADQCRYAVSDVDHLLELHQILTDELVRRGRFDWFNIECDLARRRGRVVRDPQDAWRRIKEARTLRGEQAAVARGVAAWRERRAAELDQPVRFVLSDLAVVGVAQRRPRTIEDLARIRGVDERQARGRMGEAILAAVAEGLENPVPRSDSRSYEVDRHLRPAIGLVSAWVSQLSRDLEIETSILATRADIESLLARDPDSRLATGWRADLLGQPIWQLVNGEAALAFDGRGNLILEARQIDV